MRVAIIGNPNTGKTTLFNALTGLRQRVGNYPGVTVSKKSGFFTLSDESRVELIDLPGIYSLAARSLDERVALDVLCDRVADTPRPDALLVVCDVTNLLRNLFLPSQLAELGLPLVIVLNHMDEARRLGMTVDAALLSRRLGGVPVVPCSAARAEGVADVRAALLAVKTRPGAPARVVWPEAVRAALDGVAAAMRSDLGAAPPEAEVQRVLFDANSPVLDRFRWAPDARDAALRDARERIRQSGYNPFAVEAVLHYDRLREALRDVLSERVRESALTRRLDAVLLHRFWGLVFFVVATLTVFLGIFWLAKFPMDFVSSVVDAAKGAAGGLAWFADKPMLQSLVTDGVIGGVGAFLVFLPQILILFFFISLLENSGYMARAAFLMDKLFSWCGLNGKSFVPLLSGYACSVPAIMASRTIEDPKARAATAFVTPFMSCSARFPVYALMISAFIAPRHGAWYGALAMAGMHLLGLLVAVPTAFVLTRFILRTRPSPFVLELPRYQIPGVKDTFWLMWQNAREFVSRAGTVIFAITVVVWALTWFPHDAALASRTRADFVAEAARRDTLPVAEVERRLDAPAAGDKPDALAAEFDHRLASAYIEDSYMGRFGKKVQPVFDPAGFDWKITVGVLASFPAREVIVSTLGITYALGDDAEASASDLRDAMAKAVWSEGPRKGTPIFTVPVAFGIMAFFALCSQCGATLATLAKESGARWAVASFVYMTALAWIAAVLCYRVGSLF